MSVRCTVSIDIEDVARDMDEHEDLAIFLNTIAGYATDDDWLDDAVSQLEEKGKIFVKRLAEALQRGDAR